MALVSHWQSIHEVGFLPKQKTQCSMLCPVQALSLILHLEYIYVLASAERSFVGGRYICMYFWTSVLHSQCGLLSKVSSVHSSHILRDYWWAIPDPLCFA